MTKVSQSRRRASVGRTPLPARPNRVGASFLRGALAAACPRCNGVIDVLSSAGATPLSASQCARGAGFRSRVELASHLASHGLPPFRGLRDCVRVLTWLLVWEDGRVPLMRQGYSTGREPSVCYRTVKRVTGMTWRESRALGFNSWLGILGGRVGDLESSHP